MRATVVVALLFSSVLALGWPGSASPREASFAGEAMRGPGAALRARIERLRALIGHDPQGVRTGAEELLASLRPRLADPDELLGPDTVLAAAREVAGLRADAVLTTLEPLNGTRRDFLRSVAGEATVNDWRWGVPASITLAQSILESSWGRAAPGHNLFGLKGEGPAGSIERRVVEYRRGRRTRPMANFRLYNDAAEAIADHGEIVGTGRRYARARAAGEDAAAFAGGLVGVYATDPRYARKLLRIIDEQHLDRFDLVTPSPWQ